MQHPEPDDGAWPARVLRNRRMNQVPETENPATRLQFMHQRLHHLFLDALRKQLLDCELDGVFRLRHWSCPCSSEGVSRINSLAASSSWPERMSVFRAAHPCGETARWRSSR
jgi:hypothetical protein